MKPPMRQGSPDDFQTPPHALNPLYPYLDRLPKRSTFLNQTPHLTVWEPACGYGWLVDAMEKHGYKVLGTDLYAEPGRDFLTWLPDPFDGIDAIVTNPPYKFKQQFLYRCYSLKKPFALLLPLTTLETGKRQAMFQEHGVEIIFFDKRINFRTPSGEGSGSWFGVAWFTWGLNIGRQMTFTTLEE